MIKKVVSRQASLFPMDTRGYADRLGLNWWAVKKLHDDGWLSFDPDATKVTNEIDEAEFTFLCNLIASGCDPILLKRVLRDLDKPYAYSFDDIYFDWRSRSWVAFPKEKSRQVLVEELIREAIEDEDLETLEEVQNQIEAAIDQINFGDLNKDEDIFLIDPKEDQTILAVLKLFKMIENSSLLPDGAEDQKILMRVMDAIENIPRVTPGEYAKITISGPELKAQGWVVSKWWSIELDISGALRIMAQGFARGPETGGDSFTSMDWEIFPGDSPSNNDYTSRLYPVPGLLPFPEEVKILNLENGYELEFHPNDD